MPIIRWRSRPANSASRMPRRRRERNGLVVLRPTERMGRKVRSEGRTAVRPAPVVGLTVGKVLQTLKVRKMRLMGD